MSRSITEEDLFSVFRKYEEQLGRIQSQLQPEQFHYIGASGEPTFQGTWVNYDNGLTVPTLGGAQRNARFYKDRGRVYLDGVIKNATVAAGGTAFFLPSRYRPAQQKAFIVLTNTAAGYVTVEVNGSVSMASVNGTYVFLDAINFYADGS